MNNRVGLKNDHMLTNMQGVVFFREKKLSDDVLWGDIITENGYQMAPILSTHYAVRVPLQENLASNVAGIVLHQRTEPSNLVRFPESRWTWFGGFNV